MDDDAGWSEARPGAGSTGAGDACDLALLAASAASPVGVCLIGRAGTASTLLAEVAVACFAGRAGGGGSDLGSATEAGCLLDDGAAAALAGCLDAGVASAAGFVLAGRTVFGSPVLATGDDVGFSGCTVGVLRDAAGGNGSRDAVFVGAVGEAASVCVLLDGTCLVLPGAASTRDAWLSAAF
ncbi:MAG: hypothetical protein AAF299_17905, partial [Pseudomonadota bacterium]